MDETTPAAPRIEHRNDVLRAVFRDRSFLGVLSAAEAGLGLVMMAFFSLMVKVVGGVFVILSAWLYGYPRFTTPTLVVLSLGWLPLAWLEWRSLVFFFDGLAVADHPVPVNLATRLPARGPFARTLVALWWLAHAAAVVMVAEGFVHHLKPFNPAPVETAIYAVISLGILFGTAFAMNTHLLISIYAITRSERLLRLCYHLRIALDLTLVLALPKLKLLLTQAA